MCLSQTPKHFAVLLCGKQHFRRQDDAECLRRKLKIHSKHPGKTCSMFQLPVNGKKNLQLRFFLETMFSA